MTIREIAVADIPEQQRKKRDSKINRYIDMVQGMIENQIPHIVIETKTVSQRMRTRNLIAHAVDMCGLSDRTIVYSKKTTIHVLNRDVYFKVWRGQPDGRQVQ